MKKYSKRQILSVMCLAFSAEAIADDAVKESYYAQMPFRETPFADIRGIHPLSAEKASTMKHFALSYDALGRVVEMKFKHGDKTVPLNISRNAVTHAAHIKISYKDNLETRVFFDAAGNPTNANGVFKEVYQLDSKGNRISLTFEDFNGQRIESGWDVFEYNWEIDKRGTVTEQRFNKVGEPVEIRPGFPFYCLKLHYDQRGYLAMMENYGLTCEKLTLNSMNGAQDKLEYDTYGNMIAWNVYDDKEKRSRGNGPKVARGIMTHDETGQTLREYYEDEYGNMIANAYNWMNTIATFDTHGNMTSRFNHDADGNRMNNPSLGLAGYRLTFDDEGLRRTALAYFDEDNQPAVHKSRGYHMTRNTYDFQGNRVSIKFFDVEGELVNRADNCAAEYRYTFNAKKQLQLMKLYDKGGNAVKHCSANWSEAQYIYSPNGLLQEVVRK